MQMLDTSKLIQSFEEIIGWTYESPGSNDQNGIDCSGAFVRAYRAQGASIYHGSNTIYREYCGAVRRIGGVSDLMIGVAVFKHRTDGGEPSKYQSDGIGNMYHIGLVTSVNPLRIVHATTPVAKVDTAIGNWSHYGFLDAVSYGDSQDGGEDLGQATVIAPSGSTVNMRAAKKTNGALVVRVPVGASVTAGATDGEWTSVQYLGYSGYMMSRFLEAIDNDADDTSETVTITLPRDVADQLMAALTEDKGVI